MRVTVGEASATIEEIDTDLANMERDIRRYSPTEIETIKLAREALRRVRKMRSGVGDMKPDPCEEHGEIWCDCDK